MKNLKNEYKVQHSGFRISNLPNAYEYALSLENNYCGVRVIGDKITELYFFNWDSVDFYILSVTSDKYDTYRHIDNKILRCDGEIYNFINEGIQRVSDKRLYKSIDFIVDNIPDVVCTALYLLNEDDCLKEYRAVYNHNYDLNNLDINKLKELLNTINYSYLNDKQIINEVRTRLKLC